MNILESYFTNINNCQLHLDYSDFFRLEFPWKSIKDKLCYNGPTYLALIKNYNNLEWFEDADNCLYQYRKERRKRLSFISEPRLVIFDWLAKWPYGYGVRPEYPLGIGLIVIFIFFIVFLIHFGFDKPYLALNSSTTIFISNPETDSLTGIYWIAGVLERIIGWMLMTSFLVVLAKKTIK